MFEVVSRVMGAVIRIVKKMQNKRCHRNCLVVVAVENNPKKSIQRLHCVEAKQINIISSAVMRQSSSVTLSEMQSENHFSVFSASKLVIKMRIFTSLSLKQTISRILKIYVVLK